MPRKAPPPSICGALVSSDAGSPDARVDVCGQPHGHTEHLDGDPIHRGRYTGMVWETYLTPRGKKATNIIDMGGGEREAEVKAKHHPTAYDTHKATPAAAPKRRRRPAA